MRVDLQRQQTAFERAQLARILTGAADSGQLQAFVTVRPQYETDREASADFAASFADLYGSSRRPVVAAGISLSVPVFKKVKTGQCSGRSESLYGYYHAPGGRSRRSCFVRYPFYLRTSLPSADTDGKFQGHPSEKFARVNDPSRLSPARFLTEYDPESRVSLFSSIVIVLV
jgi:hypothetical protein